MGTQWQAPDIQGAMRQGQEYRTNQMLMERQALARAALQNFMRPPPVQQAPAMQPGSSGPPITGAPLPPVGSNAMGAGAGAPPPVAAPATPVNAALNMRDITPLLQFAGDNGPIDALIAQDVREKAAAAAEVDNVRQQSAADIQRGQYTQELLRQGAVSLLDDQSDEAILRNAAQLAAMPGADVPMINANRDALLDLEPAARAIAVRRAAAIDAGASRAAGLTEPNLVPRTDGASSWYEDMNRNSETFGQRFSSAEMQETPGQRRQGENREEDRTAPDFRERTDGATRWLEDINPDSATFGQRRSARTIQPPPRRTRRGRDGPPPRDAVADVTTRAEAEALAPGTRYRTPDGRVYTR
jgi:hypothetical protein